MPLGPSVSSIHSNHFTGLFCPSLVEVCSHRQIASCWMIQKRRNVLMMIGSEIGIERADCLACRRNSAALLEHENLGAFLGGRGCGGKAAVAGTDHNDIDVDGLIYFSGMAGLSRHEPCARLRHPSHQTSSCSGAQPVSAAPAAARARCSKARQKLRRFIAWSFMIPLLFVPRTYPPPSWRRFT